MWSAKEIGVELDYASLSEFYSNQVKNLELLKDKIKNANGIIISQFILEIEITCTKSN